MIKKNFACTWRVCCLSQRKSRAVFWGTGEDLQSGLTYLSVVDGVCPFPNCNAEVSVKPLEPKLWLWLCMDSLYEIKLKWGWVLVQAYTCTFERKLWRLGKTWEARKMAQDGKYLPLKYKDLSSSPEPT